jgi:TctA family transporter
VLFGVLGAFAAVEEVFTLGALVSFSLGGFFLEVLPVDFCTLFVGFDRLGS